MNFEDYIKQLEDITEKLSSEEIGLEEATKLFEKGNEIIKQCDKKLNTAKGKIITIEE